MAPLDPGLLERARAAAQIVADAERRAQLARADYHAGIRRLHLAGGSLREIGDALDLSHQRVQQIVDRSGGSWWRNVWKSRKPQREAVCTFCDSPPSDVSTLIAGPNVYVCGACVVKAQRVITRGTGEPGLRLAGRASKQRCSFCNRSRSPDRSVAYTRDAAVCTECLAQCQAILADRTPGSST